MKSFAPTQVMLTCPECSQKSPFSEAQLLPGRTLACPQCGAELTVSHDRDIPDGPPIWRLEVPVAEETPAPGA